MNFGVNITPIEVIKEGTFGGNYFRGIYSNANNRWYKKSQKEFNSLRYIDPRYYCSNYYDVEINKYGIKCGTSLRLGK